MILQEIAEDTRKRVEEAKKKVSFEEIKQQACGLNKETGFPAEERLRRGGIHFICEVKKASPSKGLIAEEFPYIQIAKEYEEAGADLISCLTEPHYFQGSDQYLSEIKKEVSIPVLRKDFTIDAYQIYEAKVLGADLVLLICALLPEETLREYIDICDSLGLSALVEVHDEDEMKMAVRVGARIIGVNNRNLKDFTVDIKNSTKLRAMAPEEVIFVAESGIRTAEAIAELKEARVNGVLIGETLMRSPDKKAKIRELLGE